MRVIIASIHFAIGHTTHLKAYFKMAEECGYETALYLDKRYLPYFKEPYYNIITEDQEISTFKPDLIWIYNIGVENIKLIQTAKSINCKTAYVLHEPFSGIKELFLEGSYIYKSIIAYFVNLYICKKVDVVILSSRKAQDNCKKYLKKVYSKSIFFPLIYLDLVEPNRKRKYFSYIGGFSEAHGSIEFLNFVKQSYNNNIYFQIATRDEISKYLNDNILQKMINEGRLVIQQGRPLDEHEINTAYKSSICIWNAYKRSTQSGVLASSFMQGTPVLATHTGSFDEYIINGENGVFIDNYEYDTILSAYNTIETSINKMQRSCRDIFISSFYYKEQIEKFVSIIKNL